MELFLENDLIIQCDRCGTVHIIDKDSLDVNTYSYERNMGDEVEYNFVGETDCDQCGCNLKYLVRGYEYPVGALNYTDSECQGGHFLQSPEVGVDYYEFDYDYQEEEEISDDVHQACENIFAVLNNKNVVYSLTPREFEELVAELFVRQGFNVELTPETRDGGCDIIATKNIGGLPFMLLIECKRYSIDNPVDVSLIRSLLGVQTDRKANKAVLVTTSRFTKPARDFAERQQHLISLIDIDDLMDMLPR